MNDRNTMIASIHLSGGRFDDGALDLNALEELQAFQKMVLETAKFLWKRSNNSVEILPENFENRSRISMRTVETKSVALSIEIKSDPSQIDLCDVNVMAYKMLLDLLIKRFNQLPGTGFHSLDFPGVCCRLI